VSAEKLVRVILTVFVFLLGALAFIGSAANMDFDKPPICETGSAAKLFTNCQENMKRPTTRLFSDDLKELGPASKINSVAASR
jgi:hypothetical protein